MKKNEQSPCAAAVLGAAVLSGLVLTLLLMAVTALAILAGGLSADKMALWADVCLAVGSVCAAFVAARRASSWQPLWGLGAGVLLFICLVSLSLAWFGQNAQLPRLLVNAALSAVFAAAGGALGAHHRKRKRHKKSF